MSAPAAYLAMIMIWSTTAGREMERRRSGLSAWRARPHKPGHRTVPDAACRPAPQAPWHRSVRRTCLSGAIGVHGAMLCIYWAARYVPSGLIAVLFGLSPLVTTVIAQPLPGKPGITPARRRAKKKTPPNPARSF